MLDGLTQKTKLLNFVKPLVVQKQHINQNSLRSTTIRNNCILEQMRQYARTILEWRNLFKKGIDRLWENLNRRTLYYTVKHVIRILMISGCFSKAPSKNKLFTIKFIGNFILCQKRVNFLLLCNKKALLIIYESFSIINFSWFVILKMIFEVKWKSYFGGGLV